MNNEMDIYQPCGTCKNIRKMELHAHLTGCYSRQTLKKLAQMTFSQRNSRGSASEDLSWLDEGCVGFDSVFKYFALSQAVTCTPEAALFGCKEVIRDFSSDNVAYLELRTTPRDSPDGNMTAEAYIEAVLKAIEETNEHDITVRLILSIDRRRSLAEANKCLELARRFNLAGRSVIGLDLSGDPRQGDARDFVPILREAQLCQLPLALHLAEIDNPEETRYVLGAIRPKRIGHGTFIRCHSDLEHLARGCCMELCPTSNVLGGTVDSYFNHHLLYWQEKSHPLSICTDDSGAFGTSLSRELHIAAMVCSDSANDGEIHNAVAKKLASGAVDAAFDTLAARAAVVSSNS